MKQTKKAAKRSQVWATPALDLGLTEGDEEGWATEDEVSSSTQG